MFQNITAKLGNMRKAASFTVYPQGTGSADEAIIQSDKRIAKINLNNGHGLLSDGKGGHQGFLKLNRALGAMDIVVPMSLVEQIKKNRPKTGDDVGPGVVIG
jgi:hypothetical protein